MLVVGVQIWMFSSADHPEDYGHSRIMEDSELKNGWFRAVTIKSYGRSERDERKKYDNISNWKNDDKPDCCWFSNWIVQNNYHFSKAGIVFNNKWTENKPKPLIVGSVSFFVADVIRCRLTTMRQREVYRII